jgi:hypothetical protein
MAEYATLFRPTRFGFEFQTANAISIVTVIASASEAIHGAAKWKDGLLRRFRLRSLSYGGQVAPRNDVEPQLRILAADFARGLPQISLPS